LPAYSPELNADEQVWADVKEHELQKRLLYLRNDKALSFVSSQPDERINMSDNVTKKVSRTDWTRLEHMSDEEIDYTDIPPLTESFFQRAKLYVPHQRAVMLDEDVVEWLARQETSYQSLVNTILRNYIKRHPQQTKRQKGMAMSSAA